MEALGVPSMVVITDPFLEIVAAFAPTIGMTEYPATPVPHPVAPLDDDDLRKLASTVIDDAVTRLTQSV